ncbi:MAG TPA: TetR/AcrR family transcriptional regulator [Steroidobacteraceae bacterium]|nr:TetR/AcrR family transcriptional regulator [Steroidobacteraceae bacterium]
MLAAVDNFWKSGFHASSTRDIAKRAKLSPAAVYVHFKSKEELLFTIIVVVAERLHERLAATSQEAGDPTDRLKRIVQDYVTFPLKMYKAACVANTEFNFLNPAQRKDIVQIRDALELIVADCLRDGCATGEFKIKDIDMMRMAILALCRSVLRWYSPRGRLSPEQIGEYYAELVVSMVKPPK